MLVTRFESVDGKSLRVARDGVGPALFLLHGYPENLQIWSRLVPLLKVRFEVFAFDWPGMGESQEWRGGTTPLHQAAKIKRLMEHWNLSRVSLLGMDMGGQPALVFAAQFPDLVESVTVMNSLLYGHLPTSWEITILRRFGWNRTILRHLPRIVFARAEMTFLSRGDRLTSAIRADLWNSFQRPQVRRFLIRLCAGYQGALSELPEIYRAIRCPVLAVWGGKERHFSIEHAMELVAQVPTAALKVLSDGQHWLPWSHPKELSSLLCPIPDERYHFGDD